MLPPVVDIAWVQQHADEVHLADGRWYLDGRKGEDAYREGHIPGAVFVDLDEWLSGGPGAGGGRHPFPDPEVFASGMSQAGISDGSTVVAYDDQGGVFAARLVWMLRALGESAALLDGGIESYDGPLEQGDRAVPAGRFTSRPWPPDRLATVDDATDAANVVIDARAPSRYQGLEEPLDPRAGHIPGAVNVPCRENLGSDGKFLPLGELRERFSAAGVTPEADVVAYCGSGVTACHNLLALELCGFGQARLYPGSWSEYSSLPGKPVATGPGAGSGPGSGS
ncbi:MAG TPA: sulfurtransferase [Acidimicrobiales bacterium]|nr:sulfurtransferase [Acidimicrobiales bacterium]